MFWSFMFYRICFDFALVRGNKNENTQNLYTRYLLYIFVTITCILIIRMVVCTLTGNVSFWRVCLRKTHKTTRESLGKDGYNAQRIKRVVNIMNCNEMKSLFQRSGKSRHFNGFENELELPPWGGATMKSNTVCASTRHTLLLHPYQLEKKTNLSFVLFATDRSKTDFTSVVRTY